MITSLFRPIPQLPIACLLQQTPPSFSPCLPCPISPCPVLIGLFGAVPASENSIYRRNTIIMRKQDGTFEQDIQCITDPSGPLGAIFISNLEAASNPQTLAKHRIGAVITAARGHNLSSTLPPHIEYLYIPAVDHESFDISKYFATAHQLLEEELPRTNVLVHCMAGVSRSATLVIAYLMRARGMSLETAFAVVKRRRPIISPNSAFVEQLKRHERSLGVKEGREGREEKEGKEAMEKSTSSSWYSRKPTPPPSEQLYDATLRQRIRALLRPC